MSLGNIWESRQAQGREAGLEGHTALPWLPPHPSEALRVDAPHHQLFRSEQVPEPWRECLPPLPAAGVCPAWAPGGSPQSSLLLSTSPRWDRNKELRGTAPSPGKKADGSPALDREAGDQGGQGDSKESLLQLLALRPLVAPASGRQEARVRPG